MSSGSSIIPRRQFLAGSAATLISAGLSGCCHIKPTTRPFSPAPPALYSLLDGKMAIDAHCHVFNGTDLQVRQFIKFNKSLPYSEAVRTIAGDLVQALTWLAAPTGCEEYHVLEELAAGRTPSFAPSGDINAFHEHAYRNFRKEVRKTDVYHEAIAAEKSKAADDRSQGLRMLRDLMEEPTLAGHLQRAAEAQNKMVGSAKLEGLIEMLNFVRHGFHYRFENVHEYLDTFNKPGSTGRAVELMIANLVDYDWALNGGGGTRTSLQDQVAVMERLSIFTHGRVHAMVPFDPMRAVAEAAGKRPAHKGHPFSLKDLQDAILHRGFLGVKLYPVMGFKPYNNANEPRSTWAKKGLLPEWMSGDVTIGGETHSFGCWLDKKLEELYAWCEANQVPITLHADNSQEPDTAYAMFPFDSSWGDVLLNHPNLRVNFGHFGSPMGDDNGIISDADSRLFPFTVGPKAGTHFYGDLSYPNGALAFPDRAASTLSDMFRYAAQGAQSDLHDRVLYGTDWIMLLIEKNSGNCLNLMEQAFEQLDAVQHAGASYSDRFFALNAIEWLGLGPNGATRTRLENFYLTQGLNFSTNPPRWMSRVDALLGTKAT